jgi:DNA polymerase-1
VVDGERDEVEALVRAEMADAGRQVPGRPFDVPLDVSVGIGPNWHDAGH